MRDMSIKIKNLTKEQKDIIFDCFDYYYDFGFVEENKNMLEEVTDWLGIGKVKGIKVDVYEYMNKYDIVSTNAEFIFNCENGKVEIIKELPYRKEDDELNIRFYNKNGKEIDIYDLDEEIYEKIEELENFLGSYMYELPYVAECIIEKIGKEQGIYYLDLKINLNKFKKEEREVLEKALKILEVA